MPRKKATFTLREYFKLLDELKKKEMTYHVQMSIEGALGLSDRQLSKMFDRNGKSIRKELKERYAKGERLLGAEGCEGFDPVTGCPGHNDEKQINPL